MPEIVYHAEDGRIVLDGIDVVAGDVEIMIDPDTGHIMMGFTTPVDWEQMTRVYDPKNMLKLQLSPEDDVPAKRVYVLWLTVKCSDDDEAYWDYEAQKMVEDIIGGVFESEDRANFARDIYQHRSDYVSSYIQSVKLNELLWKVKE